MRALAYVEKIKTLKPIIGADAIECAEILGWEVVVRRGQFCVNELVIYVETDAILPELSCFEFLRNRKFRIKIIKLRGQISMGIVFPLSIITDINPTFNLSKLKIGDDVTEILKIQKYDPEAELDINNTTVKKSWVQNKLSYLKYKLFGIKPAKKGNFPSDIPKTEETRVQVMGKQLYKRNWQPAYITEKLEGTSGTFIYRKTGVGNWFTKLFKPTGIFQVCSRNQIVYSSQNGKSKISHHLISAAEKYNIQDKLIKLNRNIAIQGECIGPKIQGNIYKLNDFEFKVFLIYDIDKKMYLSFNDMIDIITKLDLEMVPIVSFESLENDIKYYVERSKGQSILNTNIMREGIVVRTTDGSFSFKSINPEYLLKQE